MARKTNQNNNNRKTRPRNGQKKKQPNSKQNANHSADTVMSRKRRRQKQARRNKRADVRNLLAAVTPGARVAIGEDQDELLRFERSPVVTVQDIEDVDTDLSHLLGEIGHFAATTVTKVPVNVNTLVFYELCRVYPLYAISKRMPNSVIEVNNNDVGVFTLAALFCAQDFLGAMLGQISLMQQALLQHWELRAAMTETDRDGFSFFFDVVETPNVLGQNSMFPQGFPVYAGGVSLGWPTGATQDGLDVMADTAPMLTEDQIRQYGLQAMMQINAFLAGIGHKLVDNISSTSEGSCYLDSVGIFAMPRISGGISTITPNNTSPPQVFTADQQIARLGQASLETEWYHWENWLAWIGLALRDENRTPPETRKGHMGVMNYADRLFCNTKGRAGTWVVCRSKTMYIENIIFDIFNLMLPADVLYTVDRSGENPYSDSNGPGNSREITQWVGSTFRGLTFSEWIYGVSIAILQTFAEWGFVVAGCTFVDESLPLATGASQVPGYTTQQIPLPSQVIEYLRSISPLASVSENQVELDGVIGHRSRHYYISLQMTNTAITSTFGFDGTEEDLFIRVLNNHLGNVDSADYEWADDGASLPVEWFGSGVSAASVVEGPSIDNAILAMMAAMSHLQPYLFMETPNSEKNGPPNTLHYYNVVEVFYRDENLFSVLRSDYQRLLNRFPIVDQVIGWDASHALHGVHIDPLFTGERKLSIPLIQAYYNESFSMVYEREVTRELIIYLITSQYVYDRASFPTENATDDRQAAIQHLGGGFFRALLGRGLKVLGGAVGGFMTGGIHGAVAGGIQGLVTGTSHMDSGKKAQHAYRMLCHQRRPEKKKMLKIETAACA